MFERNKGSLLQDISCAAVRDIEAENKSERKLDSNHPHIGLLTYAKQFSSAASAIVNCEEASATRIAITYLYGHAIELAIKSILLKNGVPTKQLKKIGHDLESCLMEADQYPENQYFEDELREIVRLLNPEYGKKHLEYHPGNRWMRLPLAACMQKSVDNLINGLEGDYRACLRAERLV